MHKPRTYTIRLRIPMRIVNSLTREEKEVTSVVVTVLPEDPYRAPELDVTYVNFNTEKEKPLFQIFGQVDIGQ